MHDFLDNIGNWNYQKMINKTDKRREALILSLRERYKKAIIELDNQATQELFKETVYLGITLDELKLDK